MNYKPSALISLLSLAAILLGGLLGYYFPDFMLSIEFIGLLFLHGLKFLVLPLIVAVIITGITALADTGKLNRSIGKLFLYFGATTFGAILVGLLASLAIQPGFLSNKEGAFIPSTITDLNDLSFTKVIADLIPGNFLSASTEHQVIGLIIFSILFGAALIAIARKGKAVNDFFEGIKLITSRITSLFIWIAPFGLFSLVGTSFARNYHTEPIYTNLASFTVTILLAIIIHFVVVLPVVLKLMGKQSPVGFYKNLIPAFTTAFGTGSSVATLPVTNECMNEGTDVDERATSLALPLGSIFNLNGTAIYLIVGSLFIAQLYGQDLTILMVLSVIFVSLLVSIGGSIIPNNSLLLMAVVLSLCGFPAQTFAGLGLLLVVDWLFDRLKVVVNVAGDAVGAAVLGETFDFKTATRTLTTGRALKDDKRTGSRYKKTDKPVRNTRSTRSDKPATSDKPVNRKKRTKVERKTAISKRKTVTHDKVESPKPVESKKPFEKKTKPEPVKPSLAEKKDKPESKSTFDITKPPAIPKAAPKPKPVEKTKPAPLTKPENKAEKDNPSKPVESSPNPAIFNPDTIERERAKISAHLEALKQKEKFKNYLDNETSTEDEESEKNDVKIESDQEVKSEPADTSTKIDYLDDKPEPDSKPEAAEEKTFEKEIDEEPARLESKEAEETSTPEEKTDEPIVYGRSKPKRPVVKKTDSEKKDEETDTVSEPEFSSENMAFGRTKRKK